MNRLRLVQGAGPGDVTRLSQNRLRRMFNGQSGNPNGFDPAKIKQGETVTFKSKIFLADLAVGCGGRFLGRGGAKRARR